MRATRTERVVDELAAHEPQLVPLLRKELPHAAQAVAQRLVAAALREGLVTAQTARVRLPEPVGALTVTRHGFDRVEPAQPVPGDPVRILEALVGTSAPGLAEELANATVNLALALARRSTVDESTVDGDADERVVALERWNTEGHNLHPCGRTRLGWGVDDVLAHDLESPVTSVGFLAVRRDLHVGDEVAGALLDDAELAGVDRGRYVVTPVHPWQRRHVLRGRYRDLAEAGAIVPLEVELPALVTTALRTLLVPGTGRYVKLSLDIQVTSTRRTISVASTRNGPLLSRLLPELIADDRVLLMAETGGSAVVVPGDETRSRDLAAIVRNGLAGRLESGEVAVPGSALPARSPATGRTLVASLADEFGRTRGIATPALPFVTEYARLLLFPVLTLATRHGIGLEAHLQNCVPTFVDGVPHRLAIRDLAGLRVHAPRLTASVPGFQLWPGSATVTDDIDVMRAKVAYTALQAHLGEVILRLGESHGLAEDRAWAAVRSLVDELYADLARQPGLAVRAHDDHAFLTAPTVPHKALLRMRLRPARGDVYVPVTNALGVP